jgi:8-oxo-dGTP pyrophosphatase MutT (NUDIX family)
MPDQVRHDDGRPAMTDDHLYRRGVGVMLINEKKHVFVGRRIDNRDEAWQMPQGGIDQGEESWQAALREVEEETGIQPKLSRRSPAIRSSFAMTSRRACLSPLGRQVEGPAAGLVSGAFPGDQQ